MIKGNIISTIWFILAIGCMIMASIGQNTSYAILGIIYVLIGCFEIKNKTTYK